MINTSIQSYNPWPVEPKPTTRPVTEADLHGIDASSRDSSSLKPLDHADFVPGSRIPETSKSAHEQLVDNTQKWVAQTFFGTLLKQMRDSPFKSEIFDGGRGGQVFQQMYDQKLAERMASGSSSKLVNSIVRRIEGRAAYSKKSAGDSTSDLNHSNIGRPNVAPALRA